MEIKLLKKEEEKDKNIKEIKPLQTRKTTDQSRST